jgi:hypothetical protein
MSGPRMSAAIAVNCDLVTGVSRIEPRSPAAEAARRTVPALDAAGGVVVVTEDAPPERS